MMERETGHYWNLKSRRLRRHRGESVSRCQGESVSRCQGESVSRCQGESVSHCQGEHRIAPRTGTYTSTFRTARILCHLGRVG